MDNDNILKEDAMQDNASNTEQDSAINNEQALLDVTTAESVNVDNNIATNGEFVVPLVTETAEGLSQNVDNKDVMVDDMVNSVAKTKGKKKRDPNDVGFGQGMKYLLGFMKPWRIQVILAILVASFAAVMLVIAPQFLGDLGQLISDAIAGAYVTGTVAMDVVELTRLGVILAVMYGCTFIFNYLQNFVMAGVAAKAQKRIRINISKKINKVPLGYFDKNGYGDTLSRVTNDVNTYTTAVSENVSTTLQAMLMVLGTIVAMFITEWRLALIVLATVPVSFGIGGIVVRFSQKYYAKQREYLGQLNGQIEENYSGQAVVMAFRGQQKAQAKFDVVNKKLAGVTRNAEFLSGIMYPIIIFVANLGYVFVCIFGALFSKRGYFDTAVIVTFFIYVRLFNNPLGQIAQGLGALQGGAASSARIHKFLTEKEQSTDNVKAHIESVRGDVEFENVKFGYTPDRVIIKDFNASVKAGQKIAIVGPTGAGKTTLINLLMRFYDINSGTIKIDGVPITDLPREEVRSMFGMVLQDTWLFEGTIKENIVYSKQGVTDQQVKDACKAANIHHFIKTLGGGYDHVMDDDSNISSGQRQLLTIARAMIQDAPMLILDEATSNVDTRTEQLIQDAMDKVSKGRTSFVIAHRLSTIKNADLILVLKDGDIIEKGNHEELIEQKGFYCDLYNSQFSQEAE